MCEGCRREGKVPAGSNKWDHRNKYRKKRASQFCEMFSDNFQTLYVLQYVGQNDMKFFTFLNSCLMIQNAAIEMKREIFGRICVTGNLRLVKCAFV